jgi:uncharacterized membrane protein YhdT
MQITVHDENRLVLHQGPWGLRAFGVLFAALGGGILWYITHGHLGEHNAWVAVVVGAMFGLAGLAMAVLAGDLLCTFDRPTHSVSIRHRRLVQPGTETYEWSTISDAALEKTMMQANRGQAPTPVYRPVFVMKDGTQVPWTPVYTGDLDRQSNCIAAVRAFTGWHTLPDEPRAADSAAIQLAAAGVRRLRIFLFPFLGIFVVVGGLLYATQVKRYITWEPVSARIVSANMMSSADNDNGTTYRPLISYAYDHNGTTLIATGTTIITMSSSYRWADAMRQRYPVGARVTAYINPANPSQGFVERELSWFPLIFVAIPLLFGLIVSYSSKNGQRGLTLASAEHVPILDAAPMGNRVLAPPQSAPLAAD